MGGECDIHPVIDIKPFGMMVHFVGDNGNAGHKAKGLRKILKPEDLCKEVISSGPAVQICGHVFWV